MSFCVLIPARLASTRLPDKPLADIAGLPMVVRVAQQAALSQATQVVVAADDARIIHACTQHQVQSILTGTHHLSGSDRLAEACQLLHLPDETIVVNVQGDEPLIDPTLINAVAQALARDTQAPMASAACPITNEKELHSPHVVKVVLDAQQRALYFSRSLIPHPREQELAKRHPALRHMGVYAYRAGFLRTYSQLAPCSLEQIESLEQLRVLWHGHAIAMHVSHAQPHGGVDTPEDLQRVRQYLQN